jgi:hypothetical protein
VQQRLSAVAGVVPARARDAAVLAAMEARNRLAMETGTSPAMRRAEGRREAPAPPNEGFRT